MSSLQASPRHLPGCRRHFSAWPTPKEKSASGLKLEKGMWWTCSGKLSEEWLLNSHTSAGLREQWRLEGRLQHSLNPFEALLSDPVATSDRRFDRTPQSASFWRPAPEGCHHLMVRFQAGTGISWEAAILGKPPATPSRVAVLCLGSFVGLPWCSFSECQPSGSLTLRLRGGFPEERPLHNAARRSRGTGEKPSSAFC